MKKIAWVLVAVLALLMGVFAKQHLDYDFVTLGGEKVRWSDGSEKWKVVNYFAEWCAPCLKEIPELNHFYQQYGDSVSLYAVSYDPLNQRQLLELKNKYAIEFPIIDSLKSLPWGQPPSNLPTTYILDVDGQLVKQLKGEQSAEQLLQVITILKGL